MSEKPPMGRMEKYLPFRRLKFSSPPADSAMRLIASR